MNITADTLAFVSRDPSPQKVPPPVAVPPIRSNLFSDSTYNSQHVNNGTLEASEYVSTHWHGNLS